MSETPLNIFCVSSAYFRATVCAVIPEGLQKSEVDSITGHSASTDMPIVWDHLRVSSECVQTVMVDAPDQKSWLF